MALLLGALEWLFEIKCSAIAEITRCSPKLIDLSEKKKKTATTHVG